MVIRPDSGDPCKVIVKVLSLLAEKFPTTINSKGYRMLPPYLRVMQSDSVSYETIGKILDAVTSSKWSADNLAFGTGGALLQKVDRDTQKCAFKCSHIVVSGENRNVWKSPSTDRGKESKRGRLTLERTPSNGFVTVEENMGDPERDLLVTVYKNGKLLVDYTLNEIRERAEIEIVRAVRQNRRTGRTINGQPSSFVDGVVAGQLA